MKNNEMNGGDFPQVRVIVWDVPGTAHAEAVQRAVIEGHGNLEKSNVLIEDNWNDIEEILNDPELTIEGIIRPYIGFRDYEIKRAQRFYPETLFYHALHNNEWKQVFTFSEWEPACVVAVGAGDEVEGRNNTSWGNKLEVWDEDFNNDLGSDQASFSLGFICGKMVRLRDELKLKYKQEISTWEARYIMRMTCDRTEPNREGDKMWDIHNGYGRINIQRALALSDKYFPNNIPIDPYIVKIGDPGKIKTQLVGLAEHQLDEIPNAEVYVLNRNGTKIYEGKTLFPKDILKKKGKFIYTYYGIDRQGNKSSMSEKFEVHYN